MSGERVAEGRICAAATLRDGRVSGVDLRAEWHVPLGGLLCGMSAEEAARTVPRVFATCGRAHGVAAARAVERAWGSGASPVVEDAREIVVLTELVESHALSLLLDWALAMDLAPAPGPLRALRDATSALRGAVDGRGTAPFAGATSTRLDASPARAAVADLAAALHDLVGTVPAGASELERWARDGDTAAARLVALVLDAGAAAFGPSDVAPLPAVGAAELGALLGADAAFASAPTLGGAPREAGALARMGAAASVESAIARWGRGTLARLVARLEELGTTPRRAAELLERLGAAGGARGAVSDPPRRVDGVGTGIADTARGRLTHWVRLEAGRVADWRVAAPTDWTFHPAGAFTRGLVGVGADEARRLAPIHVLALDPCVPCAVSFHEER